MSIDVEIGVEFDKIMVEYELITTKYSSNSFDALVGVNFNFERKSH